MIVVGISAFYHDSAAALVRDGEIVAAAQEERFTRKKHDPEFPLHALRFCLEQAGVTAVRLKRRALSTIDSIASTSSDVYVLSVM